MHNILVWNAGLLGNQSQSSQAENKLKLILFKYYLLCFLNLENVRADIAPAVDQVLDSWVYLQSMGLCPKVTFWRIKMVSPILVPNSYSTRGLSEQTVFISRGGDSNCSLEFSVHALGHNLCKELAINMTALTDDVLSMRKA